MSWTWGTPAAASLPKRGRTGTQTRAATDDVRVRKGVTIGRLNLFQRAMLRWRELHPYNAVHVVSVPQQLEDARLQDQIKRELERAGLTGFVLDENHEWLRYGGGPATAEVKGLQAGADPLRAVSSEIEVQLNTPFPRDGRLDPFRFFTVDRGDSFYLGLAYDHFVAGGDSIALLLRDIVDRYAGDESAGASAPSVSLKPLAYRGLILRHPVRVAWAMLRLPSLIASARRWFRPQFAPGDDPYNAVTYLRLGPQEVARLFRASKAWGVTLNDLLLASLLLALAPIAAERARARRRRELAVASIVNIRRDLPSSAGNAFAPFLASFQVSHLVPPGIALRELAQDVHAQTARIKSQKLYLQSLVTLGLSRVMWPFLSAERRRCFFSKYHPVWGGISTLNVGALWDRAGRSSASPLEYLRAGSTGPVCPVVLVVTLVRDTLNVVVSYRTAAFSRATIDGMTAEFVCCIESLSGGPSD